MGRHSKTHDAAECMGCMECMASMGAVIDDVLEAKTPQARKRAVVSFLEGMAGAGLLAVGQASYALQGGHFDVKVMAGTALSAFLSGCVSYLHNRAKARKATK
jgi:hypothetical protein